MALCCLRDLGVPHARGEFEDEEDRQAAIMDYDFSTVDHIKTVCRLQIGSAITSFL